jgi:hypothetical protein
MAATARRGRPGKLDSLVKLERKEESRPSQRAVIIGGNVGSFPSKKRSRSCTAASSLSEEPSGDPIQHAVDLKALGNFESAIAILKDFVDNDKAESGERKEVALYELALLYCQTKQEVLADTCLSELGIKYKLSCDIFAPIFSAVNAVHNSRLAIAYDNVLPPDLFQPLQRAFSPESIFWAAHNYPTPQFFSYNIPLGDARKSLLSQLVDYLLPIIDKAFPKKSVLEKCKSVEWWAHMRLNSEAHQLHFDLDEINLMKQRKKSKEKKESFQTSSLHPLVSAVLYLNPGSTFPTVVTNQVLERESMATEALICRPVINRILLFDGSLLHGVVPQLPCGQSTEPRIT